MSETEFKNKSVLVVDDQQFLRSVIVDILGNLGMREVYTACDGAQAIEQIKNYCPDAVITDWIMQPVDGLALTRWIRKDLASPNPALPVIMLTGNNAQRQILEARDAGISEIIIKPVVPKAVISRLHKVFRTKRKFVRSLEYVGPDRRRRGGSDYRGRQRRMASDADESGQHQTAEWIDKHVAGEILTLINELSDVLKTLDPSSRVDVLTFYKKVEELWTLSQDGAPKLVEMAAESLLRYIQAYGANGLLKPVTLAEHLSSISRLVSCAELAEEERRILVDALLHDVAAQLQHEKRA